MGGTAKYTIFTDFFVWFAYDTVFRGEAIFPKIIHCKYSRLVLLGRPARSNVCSSPPDKRRDLWMAARACPRRPLTIPKTPSHAAAPVSGGGRGGRGTILSNMAAGGPR